MKMGKVGLKLILWVFKHIWFLGLFTFIVLRVNSLTRLRLKWKKDIMSIFAIFNWDCKEKNGRGHNNEVNNTQLSRKTLMLKKARCWRNSKNSRDSVGLERVCQSPGRVRSKTWWKNWYSRLPRLAIYLPIQRGRGNYTRVSTQQTKIINSFKSFVMCLWLWYRLRCCKIICRLSKNLLTWYDAKMFKTPLRCIGISKGLWNLSGLAVARNTNRQRNVWLPIDLYWR